MCVLVLDVRFALCVVGELALLVLLLLGDELVLDAPLYALLVDGRHLACGVGRAVAVRGQCIRFMHGHTQRR